MRAIVLAGGRGSRLMPLTRHVPKPMLPVGDRPLIAYLLTGLANAGVTDVVMTIGYLGGEILRYVGTGARFGLTIRYAEEDTPLGTAGSVKHALSRHPWHQPFWVVAGDALTNVDFGAAGRHFRDMGTELGRVVTDAADMRADGQGNGVDPGLYYVHPRVLDVVSAGRACDWGRELIPAWLRGGGQIHQFYAPGFWCDVATMDAYRTVSGEWTRGSSAWPGAVAANGAPR